MRSALSIYWRGLANGNRTGIPDRLVILLLSPFSLAYALIQRIRSALYQGGLLGSKRLPIPVISVGNITVGGTGKTPVSAYLARMLMEQGYRVAILSRGYGGELEGQTIIVSDGRTVMVSARECGDEPFLLASTVPGLMVVIGTDRHAAGMLAMQQLSPDIFLLDDGFQHLRLHRDLNILLVDYASPFGNGWTLPSGLLREPKSAAQRADLVIQTRCPDSAVATTVVAGRPHCSARHLLVDTIPLAGGEPLRFDALRGRKLLAFAGIAEPDAFFEGLRGQGLALVATIGLPDHAVYDDAALLELSDLFRTSGADAAVTTEKDGVKLGVLPKELSEKTLLARLELAIDDPAPLTEALRNLLQK